MMLIKAELLKQPGIAGVTSASVNIIRYGGHTVITGGMENKMEETLMLSPMGIDKDFISFFKMQMKEGRCIYRNDR
jgi:putative ABC transport system permease protein